MIILPSKVNTNDILVRSFFVFLKKIKSKVTIISLKEKKIGFFILKKKNKMTELTLIQKIKAIYN
jgi:hypothetical protein